MQGIKPWAAAGVLAGHLLDHDFGVGKNMQGFRVKFYRVLQSFEQGDILGDIVVLMSDPFFDFNRSTRGAFNQNSNSRRTGIPLRSAINVGNEIRHAAGVLEQQCATYRPQSRR